jgi:hypothetical protein
MLYLQMPTGNCGRAAACTFCTKLRGILFIESHLLHQVQNSGALFFRNYTTTVAAISFL